MMKTRSVSLLAAFVLLFSAGLMAQDGICNGGTITGTFSYRYFGFFAPAPGASLLPTAALGVAKIVRGDAREKAVVTANWKQSFAGQVLPLGGSGVVTVNSDCTGSLVFEIPGYVTFKSDIAILDEGREIRMMPVEPDGYVLTGELVRLSKGRSGQD